MHASFFLLTVVFAICPKWHLIHLNYQRIYNRYKIRQWLFWFCSKNCKGEGLHKNVDESSACGHLL